MKAPKLQFSSDSTEASDDNEMVEVKVLMALAEENDAISKVGTRNGKWVKISMRKRILGVDQLTEDPSSSEQKDIVFVKSSADDTKVSIPSVERHWLSEAKGFILRNHDIVRILLVESQRNTTYPLVTVTDSSTTDYDSVDESSVCSTPLPPLKKMDIIGSYDHDTNGHNRIISIEREINPRNPQHAFKRCEACGSSTHTITDYYDIEWKPIWYLDSGCSRHMTGVKSYLHKYVEQPGPKVVFGDDSTCTTEGYDSIKCNGIVFTKKRGTIFNSNKEVVMIAPRIYEHSSSPRVEDTLVQDTLSIPNPPLPILSVVTPAPQDRWSQDKHIELVNIIDFLFEEKPKKDSESLQHPGGVDAMQDELK
nr:retrovirus-related Pol polyprotein from transposon TNT 1-94 [Tanacetum cinerariifolium]